ncbi:MAG TPA: glycosyltransferase [Thermomicrobiales bacterium]|nr:glycosyltransferase [Thermomicrobiales bacterium]
MASAATAPDVRLNVIPTIARVAMVTVHTSPLSALGGPDAGGLTVYVMALAEQLAASGIAVDIFTRRFDTTTPDVVEISPGIRVITLTAGPAEPVPKDDLYCLLSDFASEMALFALENGVRYDIIHTHYWLSGWVGKILKRYWDVPVVHMYHTLAHLKNQASPNGVRESSLRLRVERELVEVVDQIVAPNPDEHAELIWRLGAGNCRVCTLPPGINLERFQPADASEARKQLGLPDAPTVLFVGRIDPIKDIDTLIEAVALLHRQNAPELRPYLLIVGGELDDDGRPTGALARVEQRARELGIADAVRYLGSRPQEDLPQIYAAASVCAVSSRYESFGLVAVEAMACGTPVVATRVGGMRFTIEEDVSGVLVPPGDPEAMAAGINRILLDRDFHASLQVGARQAAIRFSWHTVGAAMMQVYERLAAGEALGPRITRSIYAS